MRFEYLAPYISMKRFKIKQKSAVLLALQLAVLIITGGCREICHTKYVLKLPDTPEAWILLLGEPCWQIEWFDTNGYKKTAVIYRDSKKTMEIELPVTLTNPVTAWPYWPEHNLIIGLFKPAGALFPYDTKNGSLYLSWEAGVDAVFYTELSNSAGVLYTSDKNYTKIPANFDWIRFRELFKGETLNKAVRENPWLVNWRSVAEKTISGNFDTRRLVPEETSLMPIPAYLPAQTENWSDFWYGASPFETPLFFNEYENPAFRVHSGINVWISKSGILRVNGNSWVFNEFGKGK
jgi:hypothetical protein